MQAHSIKSITFCFTVNTGRYKIEEFITSLNVIEFVNNNRKTNNNGRPTCSLFSILAFALVSLETVGR